MSFFIYHHNDFDGIAGGALFAKFLSLKDNIKFEDFTFHAVDYNLQAQWLSYPLQHPCAVIDFLYHPDSDWWFDHHDSTFRNNSVFADHYIHTESKYWNTKFPSCPSLILAHLKEYFRIYADELETEYRELIKWSDVIDGAQYHSPQEVYDYKNIYININKTLGVDQSDAYFHMVSKAFFDNDLEFLTSSISYRTAFNASKAKEEEAMRIIRNIIRVDDGIAYFDQSMYDLPFQRYLAYYLFPKITYCVAIVKKEDKYSVSVNYNNWLGQENEINLGLICSEYGGGGRFNVGAVIAKDHAAALEIAKSIKEDIKPYVH